MQISHPLMAAALIAALAACAPKAAPAPAVAPTVATVATATPESEAKAVVDPCLVQTAEEPMDLPDAVATGEETGRETPAPDCPDKPATPAPNPDIGQ